MRTTTIAGAFTALLLGVAATEVGAQGVTLKAGTFLVPNDELWYKPNIKGFIDRVNQRGAAHDLKINMVAAGPAAMSPFEIGNAVKTGVLDIAHIGSAFYVSLLPVADALKLATLPVAELRTNGAFDSLRQLHAEKVNAYYLSYTGEGVPFHFYLAKKIEKPDLTGLKFRGGPIYQALIQALGGTMITTPPGEAYTAMERGVVDGYGWPLWGIEAWGLHKITKYRVEPGFYRAEMSVLVHLPTWNKLTKMQQDILNEAAIQIETEFPKIRAANDAAARKLQEDAGIKEVRFEGAERERFLKAADDAGWSEVMRKDPVNGPKIRALTTHTR